MISDEHILGIYREHGLDTEYIETDIVNFAHKIATEVLREASDELPEGWYEVKTYLRRMADEIERSKT